MDAYRKAYDTVTRALNAGRMAEAVLAYRAAQSAMLQAGLNDRDCESIFGTLDAYADRAYRVLRTGAQ